MPPLDVLSPELFRARATITGFLPPDNYNAGLLLKGDRNGGINQLTIIAINLLGTAATRGTTEG